MAIDIDALRKKLKSLQSSNEKSGNSGFDFKHLWKPEENTTTKIRIIPYKHKKSDPFIEMYFHYNIGKYKMLLSPTSFEEPDPLVEFAKKLKQEGTKESYFMSLKLTPKMKVYVPIVIRGKEADGVKYWGINPTQYEELLAIIADPDYGDITDEMTGRDIDVQCLPPNKDKKEKYGKVKTIVKPSQCPITTDKELLKRLLNEQKTPKEIYPLKSFDDLKRILHEYINQEPAKKQEPAATEETTTKEFVDETVAEDDFINSGTKPNPETIRELEESRVKRAASASAVKPKVEEEEDDLPFDKPAPAQKKTKEFESPLNNPDAEKIKNVTSAFDSLF